MSTIVQDETLTGAVPHDPSLDRLGRGFEADDRAFTRLKTSRALDTLRVNEDTEMLRARTHGRRITLPLVCKCPQTGRTAV